MLPIIDARAAADGWMEHPAARAADARLKCQRTKGKTDKVNGWQGEDVDPPNPGDAPARE
jgi:hypothetical protein